EATGSDASATLTAFNATTNARIGALQGNGGTYKGQFTNVANPGTVRVTSSLGGGGTLAVSGATGTVRPAATVTTQSASARGSLVRTLPKGRVRVRFHGVLANGPLRPGTYRVMVDAVDAGGNRAAGGRAVLTLR